MLITKDFGLESELQRELMADEKLLWCDKPKGGILFRTSDVFVVPFSILWCGFAFFWEFGVSNSGAPFFMMIWGIPFMCVGLYFVFGRFIYDKINREKTVYGITTNRVIIKSGVFKTKVESFNISTLFNLSIEEKKDGTGSVKLDSDKYPFSQFAVAGWPGSKGQAPALEFIDNVREIYNLILQQQHKKQ